MEDWEVKDVLNMITVMQRIELGDLDRLTRIRNRIMDGEFRGDDIQYVRNMFKKIHDLQVGDEPESWNKHPSRAWYLLPILLSIVGGAISYACLRRRDPIRARNTLLLGLLMFGIGVAVLAAAAYTTESDGNSVQIPDEPTEILSETKTSKDSVSGEHTPEAIPSMEAGEGVHDADTVLPHREYEHHLISHAAIPDYADQADVVSSLEHAILAWESVNPSVDFEVSDSEGDVRIEWVRWMPGSALGKHSIFNIASSEGESHIITIRLGNDDCHSDYRPYSNESLQHIIAHELGHYLGLRHIDDRDHLMYSGGLFDVDSASIYDSRGYVVPEITDPEIKTRRGQAILLQVDATEKELQTTYAERHDIKEDADGPELELNTKRYNEASQRLDDLRKEIECVELVD